MRIGDHSAHVAADGKLQPSSARRAGGRFLHPAATLTKWPLLQFGDHFWLREVAVLIKRRPLCVYALRMGRATTLAHILARKKWLLNDIGSHFYNVAAQCNKRPPAVGG